MPVYNLTIPDTSPLIVYTGMWQDSPHNGTRWMNYTDGTYHASNHVGDMATLVFNGSAVYVVGSGGPNYGGVSVSLDALSSSESVSMPMDMFNQTVFSQSGLSKGQHELMLHNEFTSNAAPWFDIDYITITVGDGNPSTQSLDTLMDDGSPNITYSGGWDTTISGPGASYHNQTVHRTNTIGASATIMFYGNAIALYGVTSFDHGSFSVTIDGMPLSYAPRASAPAGVTRYQQLLFYSGGLPTDMHTVVATHFDSSGSAMWFELDMVMVSSWPGMSSGADGGDPMAGMPGMGSMDMGSMSMPQTQTPSSSSSSNPTAAGAAQNTSKHDNAGLIAGVTAAGVVGLLVLGLIIFLARRYLGRGHGRGGSTPSEPDLLGRRDLDVTSFPPSQAYSIEHMSQIYDHGYNGQATPSIAQTTPSLVQRAPSMLKSTPPAPASESAWTHVSSLPDYNEAVATASSRGTIVRDSGAYI